MGSTLGPTMANIFMSHLEEKRMKKLEELGIKNWHRFVDDIFAVIKSKKEANKILSFLNTLHPNIKFTMESEEKNILNFLDVKVKNNNNLTFSTSTYHKDMFTGVYLNWRSLTARKYKVSLIKCLLNRICPNEQQRVIKIEQLRIYLINNNYPPQVIINEFDRFIKKFKISSQPKEKDLDIKSKYIILPYINEKNEKTA